MLPSLSDDADLPKGSKWWQRIDTSSRNPRPQRRQWNALEGGDEDEGQIIGHNKDAEAPCDIIQRLYRVEDAAVEAQYGKLGQDNAYRICHDSRHVGLNEARRVGDKNDVLALAKRDGKPAYDGVG